MNRPATVVDMNVHLVPTPDLALDRDAADLDLAARVDAVADRLAAAGVAGGNVMLMDDDVLRRDGEAVVAAAAARGLATTVVLDPRADDAGRLLDRAARAGARGLKLHPYAQGLDDATHPAAVALAHHAADLGLWVMVCCSYGTVDVHRVSGPRLVAAMARAGVAAPLVALHAGGAAVLEVMGVALDAPNVLLETSFSVPFWEGSSVDGDLAFALRRVGHDRCLHGSDHPYVTIEDALVALDRFCDRHGVDAAGREALYGGTATRLLDRNMDL